MRIHLASYQSIMLNRGGPTYVTLNLEKELKRIGVDVNFFNMWDFDLKFTKDDLVHLFLANMSTYSLATNLKLYGVKYVVNPIIFSNHPAWKIRLYQNLEKPLNKLFVRSISDYTITREICNNSELILPNTIDEGKLLVKGMKVDSRKMQVIHNGVEEHFLEADPSLFIKKYGLKDFVLNVGHIGAIRKNSYRLIKALQRLDVPAVIIADVLENAEAEKCMEEINRSKNITLIRWIKHNNPLLASAYAACKTFVLPSTFETPGIVAMEAALAGANVINTPFGGTKEYFADFADYIDPKSIDSIASTIEKSLNKQKNDLLKNFVKKNFLWSVIAKQTLNMYEGIIGE